MGRMKTALRCCGAALFALGRLHVTPKAQACGVEEVLCALARHAAGIHGDVDESTELQNEGAIASGNGAVRSVFVSASQLRIVVTTAVDRSVTRIELDGDANGEGCAV